MTKHVFFDLDNTLTPSKSLIVPEHLPILKQLAERADVIVVSGHGEKDIRKHLTDGMGGKFHILGQNGNFAETRDGRVLWNRSLSQPQKDAIFRFIQKAKERLNLSIENENDLVDDRDSQVAYSLIGHHSPKPVKDAFDPKHEKRLQLLRDMSDDVEALKKANVEVRSGGTTVLDFFELGKNKGYNVGQFIETMGWKKGECLYLGDALFPGGNDETVIGVITTHAVDDYNETYRFIQENLLS